HQPLLPALPYLRRGEKAKAMVGEEVDRCLRELAVRERIPVLTSLRRWAEAIARAETERTLSSIGQGLTPDQREGVEALSRAIVNKLLHAPSARLREAGADGRGQPLAAAAAELFGLTQVPS
ncbi:MAG TPA: glutamyl-tRNA reductase, partial [Myxococcaceae bacterium]